MQQGSVSQFPSGDPSPEATARSRGLLRNMDPGSLQLLGLAIVCVVLAVVMQIRYPRYLSGPNVEVMLINFVPEAIMALGMTIIMITGGIDISVGAVLQFSAIVAAMLIPRRRAGAAGNCPDAGGRCRRGPDQRWTEPISSRCTRLS